MKILIIDNHTKDLKELLELTADHGATVIEHENVDHEMVENFDLVVLTGGSHVPAVAGHSHTYDEEVEFIKTTNKPVIGICLGCQLIAKAFNCTLKKMPKKATGVCNINISGKKLKVFESHKYCVDKISGDIKVLADSERGVEMFKHREKPIYGLQFHPERYVQKTAGKRIFNNILSEIFIMN